MINDYLETEGGEIGRKDFYLRSNAYATLRGHSRTHQMDEVTCDTDYAIECKIYVFHCVS